MTDPGAADVEQTRARVLRFMEVVASGSLDEFEAAIEQRVHAQYRPVVEVLSNTHEALDEMLNRYGARLIREDAPLAARSNRRLSEARAALAGLEETAHD